MEECDSQVQAVFVSQALLCAELDRLSAGLLSCQRICFEFGVMWCYVVWCGVMWCWFVSSLNVFVSRALLCIDCRDYLPLNHTMVRVIQVVIKAPFCTFKLFMWYVGVECQSKAE